MEMKEKGEPAVRRMRIGSKNFVSRPPLMVGDATPSYLWSDIKVERQSRMDTDRSDRGFIVI
jgi:hypothetical protein